MSITLYPDAGGGDRTAATIIDTASTEEQILTPLFTRGVSMSLGRVVEDINGVNYRARWYDAAGSLSLTQDADNALVKDTTVGAYELAAGGAVTLKSTGNIVDRPTGASVDALITAIVTGEVKLTSHANYTSLRLYAAGGNSILEGSGGAYIVDNGAARWVSSAASIAITHTSDVTITAGTYKETISSASGVNSSLWTQAGYAAKRERRYWYLTTTSAGIQGMSGAFVPAIANGVLRIVTQIVYSTASGAAGFGSTVYATFRVAAGVVTQIQTSSEHLPDENVVTGEPYHDASGGTVNLQVDVPDATSRKWEAYSDVFYAAA